MLSKVLAGISEKHKKYEVILTIADLQVADLRSIYFEIYKTDITKLSNIVTSIVYKSVRTLLSNWGGYYQAMNQEDKKKELLQFLKENLDYVIEQTDGKFTECENNIVEKDKVSIIVSCPYRKLRSIFYTGIQPITHNLINFQHSNHHSTQRYEMAELVNWPFMKVNIRFPGFEITRSNIFKSEFKLIKLTSHYQPSVDMEKMPLKYKQLTKEVESFPNTFILALMKQLRHKVGLLDCSYPSNVKIFILSVLTAFERDIALCAQEIDTNTDYSCHLSKGYVRYLAMPVDENKNMDGVIMYENQMKLDGFIKYEDQVKLDKNGENIRLQQIIYPTITFHLSTFDIMYDIDKDDNYVFSIAQEMVHNLFQYISFTCCLCFFDCTGSNSKQILEHHLNTVHSWEADWHCPKCKRVFSMQNISSLRWQHECKKKEKIQYI